MARVRRRREEFILTVCANGYGKRTSAYEYRRTGRGGQGITNIDNLDRNGPVVASFPAHKGEQLMLVTDQAKLIRMSRRRHARDRPRLGGRAAVPRRRRRACRRRRADRGERGRGRGRPERRRAGARAGRRRDDRRRSGRRRGGEDAETPRERAAVQGHDRRRMGGVRARRSVRRQRRRPRGRLHPPVRGRSGRGDGAAPLRRQDATSSRRDQTARRSTAISSGRASATAAFRISTACWSATW